MASRVKEIEKNAFTARDYQLELLNYALDHNTIVTLGTGSGKAFIAVHLIKEYGLRLIEKNEKAVLIVDRAASVDQQAAHIECHTTLRVARVYAHMNIMFRTRNDFEEFSRTADVLVVTAQVFLNLLNSGFFLLENAALLIFDECHYCLDKQQHYRLIMDIYRALPPKKRCRILGLTASIINNKIPLEKLEKIVRRLELIMCSKLEAVNDLTSSFKYGTKLTQSILSRPDPREDGKEIKDILNKMLCFVYNNDLLNPVADVDPKPPICEAVERIFSILDQLGLWFAWRASVICQKRLQKYVDDPIFGPMQKRVLKVAETAFCTCTKILANKVGKLKTFDEVKPYLNPRVACLVELLSTYSPSLRKGKDPMCALIFVRERFVAFLIDVLLRELAKWQTNAFGFINSDFVVGHGTYLETDEANAAHKRQESVLQRFRTNALNLLVATNVLEEGVDIRHCNLVVRFDRPSDFRAFVQSRGRARKENSNFYIMCYESEYNDVLNELTLFDNIQKFLQRYTRSDDAPTVSPDKLNNIDDSFPPYVVPTTKARVTMSTSIALVNRYCAKLPSDVFTRLTPQIRAYPIQCDSIIMYNAELVLPINSPVKETIKLDTPVCTKSHALMAVALKACRILHERKELNDYLIPAGKGTVATLLSQLEGDEYISLDITKKTKRRWLYDRKLSKSLMNTLAVLDAPIYLYVIDMRLTRAVGKDGNPKNRRLLDPASIDTAFGFLSRQILPVLPGFPVYQRQGEVEVHIRCVDTLDLITEDDLKLIKEFHFHVFYDILGIKRGEIAFAPENSPMPLYVVPLRKVATNGKKVDYTLDYAILNSSKEEMSIPSMDERKIYKFNETKFIDAVVIPWYRSFPLTYYYVAEICRDICPDSPFPDSKFHTFSEYFLSKYSLEIFDKDQPLLDVDHTSARMNLLLPRLSSSRRSADDLSQRQLLVPELVHIHPLSASHWSMLIALPTVMYRLNSLLLADELRSLVLKEAFNSELGYPPQFEWEMLTYPTAINDQNINKPIKNLEELKRVVSKEEESIAAADISADSQFSPGEEEDEEEGEDDNNNGEECNFAIGVWNPADALRSAEDIARPNKRDESIFDKVELSKYDNVFDDDDLALQDTEIDKESFNILLDTEYYRGVVDSQPSSAAIEVKGWDKEEEIETSGKLEKDNCGLTVFANQDVFNVNSLMRDLEVIDGGVRHHKCRSGVLAETTNTSDQTSLVTIAKPKRRTAAFSTDVLDEEKDVKGIVRTPKLREEFIDFDLYGIDNDDFLVNDSDSNIDLIARSTKPCLDSTFDSDSLAEVKISEFELIAPKVPEMEFSFDENLLSVHSYGVTPTLLLQALTTSSSGDGINLERLETIGDSFLKLAVTNYLYHEHPDQHEGKLSFARSKEVSNNRLYNLGLRKKIPHLMEASKFDPHVNWLPPCYCLSTDFRAVNKPERNTLEEIEIDPNDDELLSPREMPENAENHESANNGVSSSTTTTTGQATSQTKPEETGWGEPHNELENYIIKNGIETLDLMNQHRRLMPTNDLGPLPFNMLTQQYIGDKSIADAVEALIGSHLVYLGPRGALQFMHWLDVKVLVEPPKFFSPLLRFMDDEANPNKSLRQLYIFYKQFNFVEVEKAIQYRFGNKAYLVQAFTHASYYKNRITGCYQRLEFLGDAVLDYLITRFLFEHKKQYSPGVLTDLRSALVNNTIFASLAVRYNFHKHFIALCPGLHHMIEKFVNLCESRNSLHCTNFDDEMFMITEDDVDEGHEEDIEVPKALGDIFESLAGAVYLDCGMKMDVVWCVFYNLMKQTVEECCRNPPQSPVRELFERKNYKAQFMKLERVIETGKVRVTVDVNGMRFIGMGRSYRIAKCTAAKRALKYLKNIEASSKSDKSPTKSEK